MYCLYRLGTACTVTFHITAIKYRQADMYHDVLCMECTVSLSVDAMKCGRTCKTETVHLHYRFEHLQTCTLASLIWFNGRILPVGAMKYRQTCTLVSLVRSVRLTAVSSS